MGNNKKAGKTGNTESNMMRQAVRRAVKTTDTLADMRTGKVKFMDVRKGYGFIIDDATGKEIFFHHSAIKSGRVYKGYMTDDHVSFIIGPTEKGDEAFNIYLDKNHADDDDIGEIVEDEVDDNDDSDEAVDEDSADEASEDEEESNDEEPKE